MHKKILIAIARWLLIFLFGAIFGFFICLYTNGYDRVIYGVDATKTEFGEDVISKLKELKKDTSKKIVLVTEVLGFSSQRICVQPPYMDAKAFRQHLKVNLVGFRMANDTEDILWFVNEAAVAKYISINRLFLADIERSEDGVRCVDGLKATLQSSVSDQQFKLTLRGK